MNQHSVHSLSSVKFTRGKAQRTNEAALLPALAAIANGSVRQTNGKPAKAASPLAFTAHRQGNMTAAPVLQTQKSKDNLLLQNKSSNSKNVSSKHATSNDNDANSCLLSSDDDLRDTLAIYCRRRTGEACDTDAEVKSRRQEYAHLLRQLMKRRGCHNSLTVFIETILGELSLNVASSTPGQCQRELRFVSDRSVDEQGELAQDRAASGRHALCQDSYRHCSAGGCDGDTTTHSHAAEKDDMDRTEVSVVMRAAAGTWALQLLADEMSNTALRRIVEALLPAIYGNYRAHQTDFASPSIQAQISSPTTIRMNPYFTHPMHMEQVTVFSAALQKLHARLGRALRANEQRRTFVFRIIQQRRRQRLHRVLSAWRTHVRRIRILSFTAAGRIRRHTEESNFFRLKMTLARWKLGVEVERNDFLTERLHDAAAQLESVKNQFQLQCYRAERLIESDRKIQEKLRDALHVKTELQRRVTALETEMKQREKVYHLQLEANTRRSFHLVERYQTAITLLLQSRVLLQTSMGDWVGDMLHTHSTPRTTDKRGSQRTNVDEDGDDESYCSIGQSKNDNNRSSNSNSLARILSRMRVLSSNSHGTLSKILSAAMKSPRGSVECVGKDNCDDNSSAGNSGLVCCSGARNGAEDHLVRASDAIRSLLWWCNHVLREVQPHKHTKDIDNFGESFCNGELYWVMLVYVFPSAAHEPPAALRSGALDFGLEYKLSQLRDVASRYLQCVVEPSEFMNRCEDTIVQSLGEMYVCHVTHRWRTCTTRGFSSVVQFVRRSMRTHKPSADPACRNSSTDSDSSNRAPKTPNDDTLSSLSTNKATEDTDTEGNIHVFDNETVQGRLQECEQRFDQLQKTMLEQSCAEALVTHTCELLKEQSVYLTQEGHSGVPMYYISAGNIKPFYALGERVIAELENEAATAKGRVPPHRGRGRGKKITNHSRQAPHTQGENDEGNNTDSNNTLITAADGTRSTATEKTEHGASMCTTTTTIPHILRNHVDTVSRLYYYYAGNTADTMMEIHFWRFIWSTRVIMDEMKQSDIAAIFDRVASPNLYSSRLARVQGKSESEVNAMLAAARQEMDVRSISSAQFAEALVRIAVKRYHSNGSSSSNERPLSDSVDKFLSRIRVPQITDLAPVLVSLYDTHAQAVVRFFCNDLARIFFFYVRRTDSSSYAHRHVLERNGYGRFCGQLTLKMYVRMLQECRYVPPDTAQKNMDVRASVIDSGSASKSKEGSVGSTSRGDSADTEHSCNSDSTAAVGLLKSSSSVSEAVQYAPEPRSISKNSNTAPTTDTAAMYRDTRLPCMTPDQVKKMIDTLNVNYNLSTVASGLSFAVFVEGFAVLSNYWCPDPFVPASRKLAALIVTTMSTLSKRHSSSTLILSQAPVISMSGPARINFDREIA